MDDIKNIVEVKNLQARYGDRIILNDITFQVVSGEIFMIIGKSGCGKTTLLNHMIGLIVPFAGQVLINNQDINQADELQKIKVLKNIGVLYQSNALFGSMTLLENVSLPLKELTNLPQLAIDEIARIKLNMVGLFGFESYLPAQLSGGMQKRAAIARAMSLDPKVIFLDEPSSGLDPINSSELDKLIVDLSNIMGIAFIIVSHDLLSIRKIAQKAILLHDGIILEEGTPKQMQHSNNKLVSSFFDY